MRYLDGSIYVATTAGISKDAKASNIATGGVTTGGSGGGGCSIAMVDEPDPLLWLLVLIAALQVIATRFRRNPMAQWSGVRQQTEDGASR
jgi:hypothetical protein